MPPGLAELQIRWEITTTQKEKWSYTPEWVTLYSLQKKPLARPGQIQLSSDQSRLPEALEKVGINSYSTFPNALERKSEKEMNAPVK